MANNHFVNNQNGEQIVTNQNGYTVFPKNASTWKLLITKVVLLFVYKGFRARRRGIPGQIDQKFLKLTPSYFIKI